MKNRRLKRCLLSKINSFDGVRSLSPIVLIRIFVKLASLAPRGGTLIFSYIRRLGPFFGGQNFEFQYFLGFQKNEYFFGYENFVDIFLGSSQDWASFRGYYYVFLGLFLR